jgi:hypothetical protein
MPLDCAVVVPWVRHEQRDQFLAAWNVHDSPDWLVLQQDRDREGCGRTKNKAIARAVEERQAERVVVLDDDCFPTDEAPTLPALMAAHSAVLDAPADVELFEVVTDPPSRGTPYFARTLAMPVAASMGFWLDIGDYCAVRGLAHAHAPMRFHRRPVFGRYFPLCGMNLAFRPQRWYPWCQFIEVPRFDDIWMGWLWQREAYRRRFCFSLAGPLVRHARQSNVWRNLTEEALHLECNDALWQRIATDPMGTYDGLRRLLPV